MAHPHVPAPRERQLEVAVETLTHDVRGLRAAIERKNSGMVRLEAHLLALLADPATSRHQLKKAIVAGLAHLRAGP